MKEAFCNHWVNTVHLVVAKMVLYYICGHVIFSLRHMQIIFSRPGFCTAPFAHVIAPAVAVALCMRYFWFLKVWFCDSCELT